MEEIGIDENGMNEFGELKEIMENLREDYKFKKIIEQTKKDMAQVIDDMKHLPPAEFKAKYNGNPSGALANLHWKIHCAKHHSTPETYYKDLKDGKLS